METVAKLVYYIGNVKKVAIIDTIPFYVGSSDYCNLKIPYKEKKGFFKIEKKGSFFTISKIDEEMDNFLVNGEKIKDKTLLANHTEIQYDNIKFIFEKEKKKLISLYTKSSIRGLQFKFKFNLPFIIIAGCGIILSLTLWLFYRSYLEELEEIAYNNIMKEDTNSNIQRAEYFLKKFPASKYKEKVKKYIADTKNLREKEELMVLNAIKTNKINKIKEIASQLKTPESKLLLLRLLLESKTNDDNAPHILDIVPLIKEFEAIKQSPSVSISYAQINRRIEETTGTTKILWVNLKNFYDIYIENKFKYDMNLLKNLETIDIEIKCSYLENLLYFYDVEKFTNFLEKEKTLCYKEKQVINIKTHKKLFTKQKPAVKIKKFYRRFIKALNNYNIKEALQNLNLLIGLLKTLDIFIDKYIKIHNALKNILESKIKLDLNTCMSRLQEISNFTLLEDLVIICSLFKNIDKNKMAINIYKNPKISAGDKYSIISGIFGLNEVEGFTLIKNTLVPNSMYGCEVIKNANDLISFNSGLKELKKMIEERNVNIPKLTECLNEILPQKIEKMNSIIKETPSLNKEYIQIKEIRKTLDEARNEALQKIFDENFYVYDSATNNHGEKAQPEIDRLVSRVKEIWNKPLKFVGGHIPSSVGKIVEICKNLAEITRKIRLSDTLNVNDITANPICFLLNHNLGKDLKQFVLNDEERKIRDWNKEVEDYNDKFEGVSAEEKNTLKAINSYRTMMGLPYLKLEEALQKAAQHHAKYMVEKRVVSHFEEDEKFSEPHKRAKHYGYKGSTVGENIYVATSGPADTKNRTDTIDNSVFKGWYNSSGHHRILLCKCCKYGGIAKIEKQLEGVTAEYWVLVTGCE